jgi:hypothetical protein
VNLFPGAVTHPPVAPLLELVARLESAGIPCALGGSGMLATLGLADRVNDWDVTTDAAVETLEPLLAGRAFERFGASGVHADHKLVLAHAQVDLISRFAFRHAGGTCRIPTLIAERRAQVPIAAPESWAAAYALLEREEKTERLFAFLETHGADDVVIERLLGETLPLALAERLRRLPRRGT